MTRTFHRRFTLAAKSGVLLFAALTLYLFWVKAIIAALVLVVANVLLIERILHTAYVFRDDKLYVERGRFAKTIVIPVGSIYACRPMSNTFGLTRYLLLQYDKTSILAVQPNDEASFARYLKRLQTELSDDDAAE